MNFLPEDWSPVEIAVAKWAKKWSAQIPDPAWDELREGLLKMSRNHVAGDKYPTAMMKWCLKHPELAARVDAAIEEIRLAEVRPVAEEPEPVGKFSRKALRSAE